MPSYWLVGVGIVLIAFGVVGLRYASEIVETQHREGMTAFADAPIDDETRTEVTRYVAALVAAVGLVLVAVGVGLV